MRPSPALPATTPSAPARRPAAAGVRAARVRAGTARAWRPVSRQPRAPSAPSAHRPASEPLAAQRQRPSAAEPLAAVRLRPSARLVARRPASDRLVAARPAPDRLVAARQRLSGQPAVRRPAMGRPVAVRRRPSGRLVAVPSGSRPEVSARGLPRRGRATATAARLMRRRSGRAGFPCVRRGLFFPAACLRGCRRRLPGSGRRAVPPRSVASRPVGAGPAGRVDPVPTVPRVRRARVPRRVPSPGRRASPVAAHPAAARPTTPRQPAPASQAPVPPEAVPPAPARPPVLPEALGPAVVRAVVVPRLPASVAGLSPAGDRVRARPFLREVRSMPS
ncbi:hypothetical protein CLV70_106130 [Pseudosporangium ferrugineum]|uniref:Uncharacterized protein n=1 Tax=Pseudosporangium ferrugineum TaxID=439699 RepID=A0A2T0S7Y0_9ACTN|nr:hypothetical protein CLV70_106130 [Pseudosporangium ferrugineum]